jgi:CheY-like chemotaxis protein
MRLDTQLGQGLQGRTALLVEDESLVSMMTEDVLDQAGCEVLLAMRLSEALELAQTAQFDFAILDVNLGGGQTSYPIAEMLLAKRIPFFFATGYDEAGMDPLFKQHPRIQKPYSPDCLLKVARELFANPLWGTI